MHALTILLLVSILIGVFKMSADLGPLTAQVAKNTNVIESALVLINGFKAALDAAGIDPVALAALSASLGSEDDKLAAAVAENTPAAPPVVPPVASV